MKKSIKFLAITAVMFSFAISTFGQVSATATAAATIITPIAINKTVDMNFGNVAASGALGTVVLAPGGGRTPAGGVTLPATAGTVAAASFTVTGQANFTYSITLPVGASTISNGVQTMTVNAFTSNPTPTGLLTLGTETLTVGATLNVAANQAAGTYTSGAAGGSGPFTVTVNYN
jgi:hypothetical protein